MLPKNRRIPRSQFNLFSRGAKIYNNNLFFLRVVEGGIEKSRFCFSVSKKVAKRAVDRNRARRSGYRSLKVFLGNIKPFFMAVFSFKRMPKDSLETENMLKEILKTSHLIK